VTVDGCWKGVNYKSRELSAGDRQTCNDLDSSPEINTTALWALCFLICLVGIPIFICWWCNSCCCKGRGRGARAAAAAPPPAAAPAPVIVQVYNNNGSGSSDDEKKKKKKGSDSD